MEQVCKRQKSSLPSELPEPTNDTAVFVSVRIVSHEKKLLGLRHVQNSIQAYSNPLIQPTVVRLCELGLPLLLSKVIGQDAQEPAGSMKKEPQYLQWQFDQGMAAAIAGGNLEVVKVLALQFPACQMPRNASTVAAAHDRLEILQWLVANRADTRTGHDDVKAALNGGHLNMAKWLVTRGDYRATQWVFDAANSGNLQVVQWAYAQSGRDEQLEDAAQKAAVRGHVDIFVWLMERCRGSISLSLACYRGQFDAMEWMIHNHLTEFGGLYTVMEDAARHGRLDILRLLHRMMRENSPTAKYLNAEVHCTADIMNAAASMGHLEVVKWLHANRTEGCSRRAMDDAAGNGHLQVVKWLDANTHAGGSCRAMALAASSGHSEVVKWLFENRSDGCAPYAMDRAAGNGHLEMVEWLAENVAVGASVDAMDHAATNGHLNVVKWLHANRTEGCTFWAMDHAAGNGHLEIVQWLHENRDEGCTETAMNLAAKNGHLDVVRWLHENRTESRANIALSGAVEEGHTTVALYLHSNTHEENILWELSSQPKLHFWRFFDRLYSNNQETVVSTLLENLQAHTADMWSYVLSNA